ncbi:uncharacterized protein LOC126998994 isoform X2 [Eriocheir sinensis]|uniref:uncharacterized protein LOC126998994 isoform X2 n=1 Tax=Eriocheir sinensis TaxID=95602 RepID=UPI0021C74457|nr:uncharacterized protein LOC126998994 isoform X2 [Eriocheir sinensis]
MAAQERGPVTRLSHGCLVRLGLRPDGSLCAPDDAKKAAQGTPPGHRCVCGEKRSSDRTGFTQAFKVWVKTHIKRLSDTMATSSGGGSSSGRDPIECRLHRQSDPCQECSVMSGAGSVTTSSSTHTYSFGNCYDTAKRVTSATTNQRCSNTRYTARDSTLNAQRRPGRQNRSFGQHLVLRAGSGGSSFERRAMLVVVAMMVGSCHAYPTLPPLSSSPTRAPHTAQEPPRKDLRVCCDGEATKLRPTNVTVVRTSPTSVLVTWTRPSIQPLKYEITYKPTNAKYRVVAEVKAPLKSVTLERLLPLTQYQVFVTTVINNTTVWTSPIVTFRTSIEDPNAPGNGTVRIFSTPTILEDVGLDDVGSSVSDRKIGHVRVRAEEVGIVLLVLAVWMFAIALFFNRWGKIRMLEPYQEPYKEAPQQLLQHRPSCPMADQCTIPINSLKMEYLGHRRPRQNSVFVGRSRSHSLEVHPPRRVKSALNLTTLVLQESEEEGAMATTFT